MPSPKELAGILNKTKCYLTQSLLPFWIERSPDPEYGGFLTYFDRNGQATGETAKTFLMQIRMLYTMSSWPFSFKTNLKYAVLVALNGALSLVSAKLSGSNSSLKELIESFLGG